MANATWQDYKASIYTMVRSKKEPECMVNNAVNMTQALLPTKVLLNNQGDISIVHLMLLKNIEKVERRIKVKGVDGLQLVVDQVGILEVFSQYMLVNIPRPMC